MGGLGAAGMPPAALRHPYSSRVPSAIPCGSRFPLAFFESPTAVRASIYVFDVSPLVARRARALATSHEGDPGPGNGKGREGARTAIVKDTDTDEVLLGIVDPECSAMPYVVYRFELPLPYAPEDWQFVRSVVMSTAGFTLKSDRGKYERTVQTWTV